MPMLCFWLPAAIQFDQLSIYTHKHPKKQQFDATIYIYIYPLTTTDAGTTQLAIPWTVNLWCTAWRPGTFGLRLDSRSASVCRSPWRYALSILLPYSWGEEWGGLDDPIEILAAGLLLCDKPGGPAGAEIIDHWRHCIDAAQQQAREQEL
jgi:hypothetical protein